MEHTALLYFVGPAGAGKSTLVATLQEWMQHQRYDGVAVNLDPGAECVVILACDELHAHKQINLPSTHIGIPLLSIYVNLPLYDFFLKIP